MRFSFSATVKFLCAALALAALAACGDKGSAGVSSSQPTSSSTPRPAFAFTPKLNTVEARANMIEKRWQTSEGKPADLKDYKGRVVVMDFYATWCPPCREEVPHLIALQNRYAKDGLQVVGLNVGGDDDTPDAIKSFAKEFGIQYQLGFPDSRMAELFFSDDDRIPQTFVFDRRGQLVKRFIAFSPTMPDDLEKVVQSALADKTESATNVKTQAAR